MLIAPCCFYTGILLPGSVRSKPKVWRVRSDTSDHMGLLRFCFPSTLKTVLGGKQIKNRSKPLWSDVGHLSYHVSTCTVACPRHEIAEMLLILRTWVIFKKMKTLCDIEGEISNWTNWHIQLLNAIYKDKFCFSNFY